MDSSIFGNFEQDLLDCKVFVNRYPKEFFLELKWDLILPDFFRGAVYQISILPVAVGLISRWIQDD